MSPITTHATALDLTAALALPVLLVCGSYLGAISHGLCALTALRSREVVVKHLIVNETVTSPVASAATAAAFRRFAGELEVSVLRNGGAPELAILTSR